MKAGYAYMVLDGTLIPVDRSPRTVCRAKTHSYPLTWHFVPALLLCGIR